MKKFTIIHYSLLFLSLMYSFVFYKEISVELAILAVLFELFKPVLFISAIETKNNNKYFFVIAVIVLVTFNLLAISSGFINNYNKQSITKSLNQDYAIHNKRLTELKNNIDSIKTELNNYPTLEAFTANSPKWEDKTQLNQTWQQGKQDITNRLATATETYNKELSIKVDKYNITNKQMGYSAVFSTISKKINIETKNLILILYLMFAVMLEILIFYSKTLSNKESKNYKKSPEELTQEFLNELQIELNRRQLEAIKNSFNIVDQTKIEIKEIPEIEEELKQLPEAEKKETIVEDLKQEKNFILEDLESEVEENFIEDPTDEEEETNYQYTKKPLQIENIKKYLDYLLENSKNDIAIGYKKVAENLGLTQGEGKRIFDRLKEKNYLVTSDRKTLIEKKSFNENDFIGEV